MVLKPILHRDRVGQHSQHVVDAVREQVERRVSSEPELRDIITGLQATSTVLRGQSTSPSEQRAYITSHPHVSLVQALLEESAHNGLFATSEPGSDASVRAVEVETPGRLSRWELRRGTPQGARMEDFDKHDVRWLKIGEQLIDCWKKRIRFELPAGPPQKVDLDPRARLILLSDWGNGSVAASEVARHVQDWLEEAGERECHVIHLGDIYYAGTEWEAANRFLNYWPVTPEQAHRYSSWCLNGNHDMYAAGKGLFKVVLADPRFAKQLSTSNERTSQLHLRGDDWQVLGLDSSWKFSLGDIGGLHGRLGADQAAWLHAQVASFDGRTIALTHHQPFSRKNSYPADLAMEDELFNETAAAREHGLAAWFWGHEHRCVTFSGLPSAFGIGYAACVGHGAMPEELDDTVVGPGEWEFNETQQPDPEGDVWRTCGFAVVDLSPTGATVSYVDQTGALCKKPDHF